MSRAATAFALNGAPCRARLRSVMRPRFGPWLIVCATTTLSLAAHAATDSSVLASQLPDMGNPADTTITKADEYALGRMTVRRMQDQNEILEDAEVADYMQQLGSRLSAQTRSDGENYQFFLLRDPVVNAFALPGGFIGVNSGLFLLTKSESELASVLAHETAHVRQRHIARGIQAQSRASIAATAAMLAAVLLGAAGGDGNAMMGGLALGQSVALQQMMNFTRSQEAEADRVGITYLADAGFNVGAMPAFFEEMGRSQGLSDNGPLDLLRSHPVTRERIAETRTRAAQYPNARVTESNLYRWMQERIRVASADNSTDMTVYYSKLRDRRTLTDAERYGEALAQIKQNRAAAALPALRTLLASYPEMSALYGTMGNALVEAREPAQALPIFEKALSLFPRNVPLSLYYAEALMASNKAKQAHVLLLDLFNNVVPTPAQIKLTALAASAAGDTGDAYYYMSEYHISGGDLALANQQLELALAAPALTDVQKQRFRARMMEVRGWMREQQQQRPRSIDQ
jgi:predicted Zn-dependent protease